MAESKAGPGLAERRVRRWRGFATCTTGARADRTSDCEPWCGCPRSPHRPRSANGCSGFGWPGVSGIAIRNLHLADGVVHRIEHRQIVAAFLRRSVDQAVGVDVRIAFVGGDLVVQIGLRIGPVPLGDHDVALDALRPRRRLRGKFALRDPRGPIAKLRRWLAQAQVESGRPSSRCRPVRTARGASRPAPANRSCRTAAECVRVYWLPSWWQDSQLSVLIR